MIDVRAEADLSPIKTRVSAPLASCVEEYVGKISEAESDEDSGSLRPGLNAESESDTDDGLSWLTGKKKKKNKGKDGEDDVKVAWNHQNVTDEDYLICPASLIAFLLDQKIWVGSVLISELREITWKEDPYLSLQLPEDKKVLIKSLVHGFCETSSDDGFEDIIEGKGRGLIFLLHGEPGLGKTLTAGMDSPHVTLHGRKRVQRSKSRHLTSPQRVWPRAPGAHCIMLLQANSARMCPSSKSSSPTYFVLGFDGVPSSFWTRLTS
jgi:hypothetical protein